MNRKNKVIIGDVLLNNHASERNPHRKSIVYEVTSEWVNCICCYKYKIEKIKYSVKDVNTDDKFEVINHIDIRKIITDLCK